MAGTQAEQSKRSGLLVLWRFSLRTLLLVTTAFAVCLGLWAESARRQSNAVRELDRIECPIVYRFESRRDDDGNYRERYRYQPDGTAIPCELRGIPTLLIEKCGIDFFDSVVSVTVHAGHKDEVLPFLEQLPRLEHVFFPWNDQSDDARVKALRKALPNVKIEVVPFIVG